MCRATTTTTSASKNGTTGATAGSSSGNNNNMSSSRGGGGASSSSKSKSKSKSKSSSPAFDGASFDRDGNCVRHKSIQLAEQVKQQDGRLVWKEIKMNCPKCVSEHHKSRRVTSLGGAGKVKRGHGVHGMPNPLRDAGRKSGRHMDAEFDTPFDEKGRCHHHPNVQMATRKVRGGWKILIKACPRCIEARYDEDVCSVASGSVASSHASSRRSRRDNYDEEEEMGSVSSRSTKRSITSRTKAVTSDGKFDKNGCCTRHPTVQIAKKKLLGGRWKEYRTCPKCIDPYFDDMADNVSVSSKRSARSTTSFRSTGTARSTRSKRSVAKGGTGASRKGGGKTDRYGALPFDGEGYCHAHPAVRLAKKKALGGWKVLHDICPDCAHDASSNAGSSVRSKSSRRSSRGTGRYFDDSGSDASSRRSGKSNGSSVRKKKIRVKDMRHKDEDGKEGRYSGDVDDDHQPHGQGKMKYRDGSVFVGVWSEGSQVHGKTTTRKKANDDKVSKSTGGGGTGGGSSSKSSSGGGREGSGGGKKSRDWARIKPESKSDARSKGGGGGEKKKEGDGGGDTSKRKAVRRMKWMDYYGDPGEYTGEVDSSSNMPHGRGSMKYDHGLIQEGTWTNGQFVEGSNVNDNVAVGSGEGRKGTGKSSSSSSGQKKSSGRSGGGGRKHTSSRGGSSSRRLDP